VTPRSVPHRLRLIVVPNAEGPGLRVAERMALSIRNAATASGRCASCAVIADMHEHIEPGHAYRITMRHEDNCPAIS